MVKKYKKIIMTLLDYVILLRPTLFIPLWIFFLLGIHFSGSHFSGKSLLVLLLYTLLMGGTYILNQIIDTESDKKNEKLFLLSHGIIPRFHGYVLMAMLFFVPLIIALFLEIRIFIFFTIALIMGITYSVPPVELKGKPFLDLLWNSVGYGLVTFSLGWISVTPANQNMYIHASPYLFAVAAVYVNSTILDIKGDKLSGKITTGVFLGKKNTLLSGILLDVITLFLAVIISDYLCAIASGLALPFFIYAYISREKKPILLSIRGTFLILAIIICILFPPIIPALLFVFGIQKYYYKKRFNLNYPAVFSGVDKEF